MKKIIGLLSFFIITVNFAVGQSAKASPRESVTGKINTATISIDYGSPSVKGRKIWGGLVPFDKIWRAGANEATTFETNKDLVVGGKKLPSGKYSLFIIPNEKKCVVIFNTKANQWGAYNYDQDLDQLRVEVFPKEESKSTEKLLFLVKNNTVALLWDNWEIALDIK
tara:strand:- start:744 stop:1244 length:501 start_codon:yes stop_codon:yes gene_type:complete